MDNTITKSIRSKHAQLCKNTNDDLFSFKNLHKAYLGCRKLKRKSNSAAFFEINMEKELLRLHKDLHNDYRPGKSVCFAISDPKLREVWAADFRDRVVHHLLVSHLEPMWEKLFIHASYACRRGKGAHKAVQDLRRAISPDMFFLQVDVQSFFVSIDKNILFSIIKKHTRNLEILKLSEKIIFHDPTKNKILRGDIKLLRSVPPHKSLFGKQNCGLPIGNLTSQFFANVYLNELDQFVKHNLKCRRYFRYMDDMVFLDFSKENLIFVRKEIEKFLNSSLRLQLHPKKQILQSVKKGINFCGYIIKPEYTLIRKRTVKKLKNKLWRFNQKIMQSISPEDPEKSCVILLNDPFIVFEKSKFTDDFRRIFSSINSSYGFLRHANCGSLRRNLYEKHFGVLKIYLKPANKNHSHFVWRLTE